MNNLAVAYWEARQVNQAIPLIEQTVELRIKKLGPDHHHTLSSLHSLALMYTRFVVGPDFKPYYVRRLPELRQKQPPESPMRLAMLTAIASQLLSDGDHAGAEPLLRECLETRLKREPDSWKTFYARSQLGGALSGQKKYADAEPLLLAAYEGMMQREGKAPGASAPGSLYEAHLAEALERLVRLYEAWGKPELAKPWRDKLPQQKTGSENPKPRSN
jgi:hypothetical protein